jgi:hypothetical protein
MGDLQPIRVTKVKTVGGATVKEAVADWATEWAELVSAMLKINFSSNPLR